MVAKNYRYYYPRSLTYSQRIEIDDLLNNYDLTYKEKDFLKSIREQARNDKQLSSKQINYLNIIFRWKTGSPLIIDDFP